VASGFIYIVLMMGLLEQPVRTDCQHDLSDLSNKAILSE